MVVLTIRAKNPDSTKKTVAVQSLADLKTTGCDKLGLDPANLKQIVLADTGAEVDDDAVLKSLSIRDILIFLINNETMEGTGNNHHTNNSSNVTQQQFKAPPIQRPEFLMKMSGANWRTTEANWNIYKKILHIPTSDMSTQLYLCCDKELQTALLTKIQDITTSEPQDTLKTMKDICCRDTNPAVFRRQFSNMQQQMGEDIKHYATRLEQLAQDCEFSLPCPSCGTAASYSQLQQRDQLMRGLSDEYIRKEAYAKSKTYPELPKMVDFLSELEQSAKDMMAMSKPTAAWDIDAVKSDYQKGKPGKSNSASIQTTVKTKYNKHPCKWCGKNEGNCFPRKDRCPGWGKTCPNCSRRGHLPSVCRSTSHHPTSVDSLEVEGHVGALEIGNLSWDPYIQKFVHGTPAEKARTLIKMVPHVSPTDIRPSHKLPTLTNTTTVDCLADSGAQVCAAGPEFLKQLKCQTRNLLSHPDINIKAADKRSIDCLGFLPVSMTWGGQTTIQPVFICPTLNDVFISLRAMKHLKMIQEDFLVNTIQSKVHVKADNERKPTPEKPDKIPFKPTEDNISNLEQWFLQSFASSAFNIQAAPLPTLSGPKMTIHLKPGAHLKTVHTPIPVPFHWKSEVKHQLDNDVAAGVLEPVPEGTPTRCCSRMVVVHKRDGTPRRTVDLQALNKECLRETHHTPSPFHLVNQIPENTYKTVLDAKDGYHSIELDEESRDLTTFITEWGRYRYKRGPQGFVATGDFYTRRTDAITQNFKNKIKCVDDTLLYTKTIEAAFWDTFNYLTHCANNGITFNPAKFKFARQETDFAGFRVKRQGIAPGDHLLEAIRDFPTPKNITGARSWYGLVNQVAWADQLHNIMGPFRELLRKGVPFKWTDELDLIFKSSKREILNRVKDGVTTFNTSRTTCIATDWSKDGIGFLVWQQHCACPTKDAPTCCPNGWKLIFAGSRATTSAESRYSPVAGECLAVAWSLERARMFVLGCPNLIVLTDHRPLIGILNDKALEGIANPRLLRLKERTLPYTFTIQHRNGKLHTGPDAMSRYPAPKIDMECLQAIRLNPDDDDIATAFDTETHVEMSIQLAMIDDAPPILSIDKITAAGRFDTEYQTLLRMIRTGFPDSKSTTPDLAKPFWQMRHMLHEFDGLVIMDGRIIIPKQLRKQALDNLHAAHQGLTGMKARAKNTIWWPQFNKHLETFLSSCKHCQYTAKSQRSEPLVMTPPPNYPFQSVVADHFEYAGHKYLVIADRYTGWLEVFQGHTSKTLIDACKDLFTRFGIPEEFASDGGPAFTSYEFKDFLQTWGITHRLSSVAYPQSNGRAELAVKSAKRAIAENTGPNGNLQTDRARRALLQYKNTPIQGTGVSPAQLLLGRQLRDWTPSTRHNYCISDFWVNAQRCREKNLAMRNADIMKQDGCNKNLKALDIGTQVVVQDQRGPHPTRWSKTGTIIGIGPYRQYHVKMHGSGRVTLRNRKFIRAIPKHMADVQPSIPSAHTTNGNPPLANTPATTHAFPTTTLDEPPGPIHDNTPSSDISSDTPDTPDSDGPATPNPQAPNTNTTHATPEDPMRNDNPPRRSTRVARPPRRLSPNFRAGPSYD